MAIQRALFFANGTAYDIEATIARITAMYENRDANEIWWDAAYDSIISNLVDIRYNVTPDEFIVNPYTGTMTLTDMWFGEFGVIDNTIDYFGLMDMESIGSFDMELTSVSENSDEEVITEEEEADMIIGVHILTNLMHQTEEIDELAELGHMQNDPLNQLDSFLEYSDDEECIEDN